MAEKDLRSQVPDLVPYLLPWERVINVEHIRVEPFKDKIDPIRSFMALTNSPTPEEIGMHGIAVGSKELEADVTEQHLKLFEVPFGRDGMREALFVYDVYPKLLPTTIRKLAEMQALRKNKWSGAERGRLIHEGREPDDPIAQEITKRQRWQWPFYSQVDVNPLFVSGTVRHLDSSDDFGFLEQRYEARDGKEYPIDHAFRLALGWMTRRMGHSPDGYLEHYPFHATDHQNQVWRDSWDGYFHKDGTVAKPRYGIAALEAQVLAHDASEDAANLFIHPQYLEYLAPSKRGQARELSAELKSRANQLRRRVLSEFFFEDERGKAFGLGRERLQNGSTKLMEVRTSEMMHLLGSGVLPPHHPESERYIEIILENLLSPHMINVSGVRTVDKREARFRPRAYHNGHVWLWNNGRIILGAYQLGYFGIASELKARNDRALEYVNLFPEFLSGGDEPVPTVTSRVVDLWDDKYNQMNRIEQPPQRNQGWSVASDIGTDYLDIPPQALEPRKKRFEDRILSALK